MNITEILLMVAPTLRGQVYRFCIGWGWNHGASLTAADLAVEVAGSNWPAFGDDLNSILVEVCTCDGDDSGITKEGGKQ